MNYCVICFILSEMILSRLFSFIILLIFLTLKFSWILLWYLKNTNLFWVQYCFPQIFDLSVKLLHFDFEKPYTKPELDKNENFLPVCSTCLLASGSCSRHIHTKACERLTSSVGKPKTFQKVLGKPSCCSRHYD